MSSFGVTENGFSQKEIDDIRDEINAELIAAFGTSLNTLPTSVVGQTVGIFSDKLAELWEVMAAIYRAAYPDSASGDALDNVAAITGVARLPAEPSLVTLDQLNLDGSASIPAGRIVSVGENGNRFRTLAAVTNPETYPGTFSVAAESEQVGQVTGFSGTIDTIVTPVTGWSAKAALTCANSEVYNLSGGEILDVSIDGGPVQNLVIDAGFIFFPGSVSSVEVALALNDVMVGATAIAAGGKVRIESDTDGSGSSVQISGGTANAELGFSTDLIKGFNSLDAQLGRSEETDPELRVRREQLLRVTGLATVDAIRAKIFEVDQIDDVFVYENPSDVPNGDGVPAHAFESVIRGPFAADADIAQAIFEAKPAGILAYGTTVEPIEDSQGFVQQIGFTRATEIPIYVDITVTINTDPDNGPVYPTDGDDQIKAAIVAKGDALGIGDNVIAEQIKCQAFNVPGVVDVTAFFIDDSPAPAVSANIVIASREIATFDTSDISVTS